MKPPRHAVAAVTLALAVSPGLSAAQGATSSSPPVPSEAQAAPAAPPSASAQDIERRLLLLEQDNARLRGEVEALREEQGFLDQVVSRLMPVAGRFGGYLDVGFFSVQGNGSGIRADLGHRYFPSYAGKVPDSWVFYGDPLSTAINSRGEPADTGESRAVVFDPVDSGGKPSFLVNALNLGLFAGFGDELSLTGSIDLVPRARNVSVTGDSALGDFLDVKLAYAEYLVPVESFTLSLYAGKFDSVLGYEYRLREAPDRITVTPSLLCRYTCGAPLGLKARGTFLDDVLTVNVAVTNGSHGTEGFPFHDEIDANAFKTLAGRISSRAPVGSGLEVGVSGAFGAADQQPDDAVHQFHYGVDLHLDWRDLEVTAELVFGEAHGRSEPGAAPCNLSPCLSYRGAYGLLAYRLVNWMTPYARVDWRNAVHQSGESFVYLSKLMRVTAGSRFEIGERVIVKAEYTFNLELGEPPQFPNDVLTSSLLVKY
ncbi:outer membrane beta-barrel protein [Chondromyces apiculatus]|uniref:Uncharacterized protein n=1 Tax=Chondromyces apiculatus DSM 436 TaxID=1192034 RepID=A0A017TDA3_9BACT|nr:outer membrane beta-barrel protein [Chondromyces apiculatus]EYF06805.1 Hypothetical protein CAP_1502 [Chondromyces apiculatus DSM 436]